MALQALQALSMFEDVLRFGRSLLRGELALGDGMHDSSRPPHRHPGGPARVSASGGVVPLGRLRRAGRSARPGAPAGVQHDAAVFGTPIWGHRRLSPGDSAHVGRRRRSRPRERSRTRRTGHDGFRGVGHPLPQGAHVSMGTVPHRDGAPARSRSGNRLHDHATVRHPHALGRIARRVRSIRCRSRPRAPEAFGPSAAAPHENCTASWWPTTEKLGDFPLTGDP